MRPVQPPDRSGWSVFREVHGIGLSVSGLADNIYEAWWLISLGLERGATILWRDHFWGTFSGFSHAFRDPWGNEIVIWTEGGENPDIPAHFTRE